MSVFICPGCQYSFDEEKGDPNEGYLPGTKFQALPEDFYCPDCAVRSKQDFIEGS